MEKTEYKITYRELDRILRRNGFGLINPDRNQIDLVKFEEVSTGLLKRRKVIQEKRCTSIGFPGWTRQVNINAIKNIRRETKLTVEDGCDSETFYHGADSLTFLVDEFQGLLKRLADK
jgi:hypothetical protein